MITMKALLLYRPGEACGLLESIFQPIVQCTSMWFFPLLVVTFGSREYLDCTFVGNAIVFVFGLPYLGWEQL